MSHVKKSLATTLSVFALDSFAISLVLPIFAGLLLKPSAGVLPIDLPLNERIWKLGYLIAAFPIALIIGALFIGIFSDRLGRKRAYFITLTGELFATVFTGIAVYQKNYTWMLIGRVIGGFFAGNLTICLSVLADISQEGHHRSRLFARLGIATALSFMCGVLIGGVFSDPKYSTYFTHAFPFWIASGICLVNFFLIAFFYHETAPCKSARLPLERIKRLYPHYFVYFFALLGWFMLIQFLTADVIIRFNGTKAAYTWVLVLASLIFAVGNGLLGSVILQHLSVRFVVRTALFAATFTIAWAGYTMHYQIFLVAFLISVFLIACVWLGITSSISSLSIGCSQGRVLSINQAILGVAMALGGVLGSNIGLYFSIHWIYYFTAAFTLISFILYVSFVKES